jgi:hypothetical protein
MKELFKTLRLACYVCALPLVITAVAAANGWMNEQQVDELPAVAVEETAVEGDVDPNRAHILAADVNGHLQGRIVSLTGTSAEGLQVFFVRNGQIEQSTVTDAGGTFQVEGLVAGAYTLVAAGANGLVAHGVYVTTDAAEGTEQSVALQTAAVGPEFDDVVEFITEHTVPAGEQVADAAANELELSQVESSNKVTLTDAGHLEGRMVSLNDRVSEDRDYSNMSARLLSGSELVADVTISADGTFTVENVAPGVYDLVAAGDQGFAAISFEAVAAQSVDVPAANASYTSSAAAGPFRRHLGCCLAPPVDCAVVYQQVHYAHECYIERPVIVEEEIVYEEPLPIASDIGYGAHAGCNFGCGGHGDFGGCCGGGGGGGGGFGFGGDFGGLIGAAIGALVLSEVIDQLDEDDGVIRQPVVVPPIIIPPIISPS